MPRVKSSKLFLHRWSVQPKIGLGVSIREMHSPSGAREPLHTTKHPTWATPLFTLFIIFQSSIFFYLSPSYSNILNIFQCLGWFSRKLACSRRIVFEPSLNCSSLESHSAWIALRSMFFVCYSCPFWFKLASLPSACSRRASQVYPRLQRGKAGCWKRWCCGGPKIESCDWELQTECKIVHRITDLQIGKSTFCPSVDERLQMVDWVFCMNVLDFLNDIRCTDIESGMKSEAACTTVLVL